MYSYSVDNLEINHYYYYYYYPRKSEIGKVSKQILDRINAKVIESTGMNQWKTTDEICPDVV